jgi:hypothetical protein|tara:strand:+ start:961 stop:1377 length:417 start_codon:yes stop_codon:yes gene_type:complete
MLNLGNFFRLGQKNSLTIKNNGSFSYNGPWVQVYGETLLDRWHMGDFSSVEYTISVDLDTENKEIIKALVTATVDKASIVVFARNNTNKDLVEVTATVNKSYVDIILTPALPSDSSLNDGIKVIYTAHYFHNQNPLRV